MRDTANSIPNVAWPTAPIWCSPSSITGRESCRRTFSPETLRRRSTPRCTRNRCFGRRRQCSSPRSIDSMARWRMRRSGITPHRSRDRGISILCWTTTGSSKCGRRSTPKPSKTALPWSAPRSPALRADARRSGAVRQGHPRGSQIRVRAQPGDCQRDCRAFLRRARLREDRGDLFAGRAGLLPALGSRRKGSPTRGALSEPQSGQVDPDSTATIVTPVEQLDLATVIKSLGSSVRRDRFREVNQHAHEFGNRTRGRRTRSLDSSARR